MVAGFWIMFVIAVVLSWLMQLWLLYVSSQYLEDALAVSGLAAAVVDVGEYGTTGKISLGDYGLAYARFEEALRDNLNLDENWECPNQGMIAGPLRVERFVVYEVWEGQVHIRDGDGRTVYAESRGVLGEVYAPNGRPVEATGIYCQISCPVRGIFMPRVMARKGQLVDVVEDSK